MNKMSTLIAGLTKLCKPICWKWGRMVDNGLATLKQGQPVLTVSSWQVVGRKRWDKVGVVKTSWNQFVITTRRRRRFHYSSKASLKLVKAWRVPAPDYLLSHQFHINSLETSTV